MLWASFLLFLVLLIWLFDPFLINRMDDRLPRFEIRGLQVNIYTRQAGRKGLPVILSLQEVEFFFDAIDGFVDCELERRRLGCLSEKSSMSVNLLLSFCVM